MPGHIYLCFVWHMHQPFYKDLVSGEYKLPWTRMHALKDYYGMVQNPGRISHHPSDFQPGALHVIQIKSTPPGHAADPFLELALKPAEELTEATRNLRCSTSSRPTARIIDRYPRYGELLHALAERSKLGARAAFSARRSFAICRCSRNSPGSTKSTWKRSGHRELVAKAAGSSPRGPGAWAQTARDCRQVIPVYASSRRTGQIELSTTPFYHPILPLLCDSNIAGVRTLTCRSRRVLLSRRCAMQLERAREYISRIRLAPAGLVAIGRLCVRSGLRYRRRDRVSAGLQPTTACSPAQLTRHAAPMRHLPAISLAARRPRDQRDVPRSQLSDLIGFVYSPDGRAAAADISSTNSQQLRATSSAGRDALVPSSSTARTPGSITPRTAAPSFVSSIAAFRTTPDSAVTVTEALEREPADPLDHIFPGSWINANFDVWIGAEEDNQAWEISAARARRPTIVPRPNVSEEQRRLA